MLGQVTMLQQNQVIWRSKKKVWSKMSIKRGGLHLRFLQWPPRSPPVKVDNWGSCWNWTKVEGCGLTASKKACEFWGEGSWHSSGLFWGLFLFAACALTSEPMTTQCRLGLELQSGKDANVLTVADSLPSPPLTGQKRLHPNSLWEKQCGWN